MKDTQARPPGSDSPPLRTMRARSRPDVDGAPPEPDDGPPDRPDDAGGVLEAYMQSPSALRVSCDEADTLSPEDAEAILKVLRPIARAHHAGRNPADPGIRMLRSDLRRVAREVVRRPGYALRILILAIEEEGHALCGNEDGGCRTRLQNGRNAFCGGEGQ